MQLSSLARASVCISLVAAFTAGAALLTARPPCCSHTVFSAGVFRAVVVANNVQKLSRDAQGPTFSEDDYDNIMVGSLFALLCDLSRLSQLDAWL